MTLTEKYVVTTRHAHIYCMACDTETRLLSKRFPAEGPILDIEDCCDKCGDHFYRPFSPLEWEQLLKHALVTRKKVYIRDFHRAFRDWGPLEYHWAESSGSIIRKANLRMAREREITDEEKNTCLICLEKGPTLEEGLIIL